MFKLISSCLGIGYLKGGGTVAAVACAGALYLRRRHAPTRRPGPAVLGTVGLLVLGTWAAQRVEPEWGKDSSRVVLDEVAGLWVSMLGVSITPATLLAGLVGFRVFDIAKPLGIRALERVPGGAGVMLDDVLAGLYTNALLHAGRRAGLL